MNDFIAEGFHKLDDHLIEKRPPKIKWGKEFLDWPPERQLEYAKKLAATMNHAAWLIQGERNELMKLCEKKEQQIEAMKKALDQNNAMIQGEITRMNGERQSYMDAIAERNTKIRELENGGRP